MYDDATGKALKIGDTIKGNPTIGYGRNLLARGWSEAEAEEGLKRDVAETYVVLEKKLPWIKDLNTARKYALINMAFNMGIQNVLNFKNMIKAMKCKLWTVAAWNVLWNTPNKKTLYYKKVGRRAEEIAEQISGVKTL